MIRRRIRLRPARLAAAQRLLDHLHSGVDRKPPRTMLVLGSIIQSTAADETWANTRPPGPTGSGRGGRQKRGPVGRAGDAGAESGVEIPAVARRLRGPLDQDAGERPDVLRQPVLGVAKLGVAQLEVARPSGLPALARAARRQARAPPRARARPAPPRGRRRDRPGPGSPRRWRCRVRRPSARTPPPAGR